MPFVRGWLSLLSESEMQTQDVRSLDVHSQGHSGMRAVDVGGILRMAEYKFEGWKMINRGWHCRISLFEHNF